MAASTPLNTDGISIHAPTRGATVAAAEGMAETGISIHAPTRGATDPGGYGDRYTGDFNPRSHKGSDFDRLADGLPSDISIHAPTRGATDMTMPSR